MERTGGAKFARDQIEGIDAERGAFKGRVRAKPFGNGGGGVGGAAGERDVRVERANVEIEAEIEEGLVDLFAKLVEARMALTESGPENARRAAFGGEGADTFDGEKERLDLEGGETFDDRREASVVDIAEETQGDVKLVLGSPTCARQRRGAEPGQHDLDGFGKRKSEENTLGRHRRRAGETRCAHENRRRRRGWQMSGQVEAVCPSCRYGMRERSHADARGGRRRAGVREVRTSCN